MRYAVASRKNTDSLVKGMILFDQGGGGRGGRKRSWSKVLPVLPPVNPWSACFSFFFRSSNFEFPARIKKTKNWRESAGPPKSGYILHHCFVDCRPGGHRADTEQGVPWWQCPVASGVALDMLHWVMPHVSLHHLCMAIKMACGDRGAFVRRRHCLFRLA